VTNPLGQKTVTWTSPAFGQPTKVSDPNGNVSQTDYDALGRVIAVWRPTEPSAGGTPSYSYEYRTPATGIAPPTGPTVVVTRQLLSGTGSAAVWLSSYEYQDGFAEPIETQVASPQDGGRQVTVTRYDSRGLTALTSSAFYNSAAPGSGLLNPAESAIPYYTTTSYDALGHKAVEATMNAGTELWRTTTTDHGDHTVTVPPAGGQVVTWTDLFDKTTKVQNYLDATNHQDYTYAYTPDHKNLSRITDPNGDVTSYTYDWQDHTLTVTDPDSGTTVNTYDDAGNLASRTDAKGQKISTEYDALNRETATWAGDPNTGTKLTEHTYDTVPHAIGQPATATSYSGGRAYTVAITGYDARYRITNREYRIPATDGFDGTYDFSYGYDGADHQTSITYPPAGGLPAETVTEKYTALGLPDTLTGAQTYVAATTFAGDGKLAERQYSPTLRRDYTYQPTTERLATIQTVAGGTTVQDDEYGYDPTGSVTSITDHTANQTQCFGYDGRHRLTTAYTNTAGCTKPADGSGPDPYNLTYTYDGAGNITSSTSNGTATTYTYPAQGSNAVRPHAVTAVGTNTYTYDADGNLATRSIGGASSTLTWDPAGQLASVATAGASTSFEYGADGNRLIRRDPGSTTLFLDNTELTVTGGAAPVATRYYTTSEGTTVAERTPAGLTWLAADAQGSESLAVTASGTVSRQRYLPYGAPRGATGQIPGDRGFLGKVQDASTDLDLLDTRYYDPTIGRFASPDPMDNNDKPDAANPYAYANDNPTTFTDPSGMMVPCESGAGGCGTTGHPGGSKKKSGGGGGGCSKSCRSALRGLVKSFKKNPVHRALAIQLMHYILTLYGVEGCGGKDSGVSSGVRAACQDLIGAGDSTNWVDLGLEWAKGPGLSLSLGALAHLTRQLSHSGRVVDLGDELLEKVFGSGGDVPLGGAHDYVDGKGWGKLGKFLSDNLGMLTDGANGSPIPEAFLGSYTMDYQVIKVDRKAHSITVGFAVYNETGVRSLTHLLPDMPRGNRYANVSQRYFWTETFTTPRSSIPDPPMGYGGD
jgi:RHS repeat-associated protein